MIVVNVLHLVGAVFVVGPLVVLPMLGLYALRKQNLHMAAHLARLTNVLNFASLAVALLGFTLVSLGGDDEKWSMSTPWILASAIIYLIAFAATAAVVVPQMRSASRQPVGMSTPATSGRYPLLAASSGVVALLLVSVVVLMVAQPGS